MLWSKQSFHLNILPLTVALQLGQLATSEHSLSGVLLQGIPCSHVSSTQSLLPSLSWVSTDACPDPQGKQGLQLISAKQGYTTLGYPGLL